eukprot:3488813-Prymnesium_polylepis.1
MSWRSKQYSHFEPDSATCPRADAFLMLPFLVLRVPVLHGLITRKAIPTGYSNSGFIGAMLSPAQIDKLKKEREQRDSQETRQERSATIKGDQDSECCWGIARCPRHIEKSDYGLMINEDELIRSKTSQVAGSLAHSSSEAAEAVFDVLTACAVSYTHLRAHETLMNL